MIGNVHFVTIPASANASAAAKVVANFLLSPDAQLRKADPAVWGDPSVLDPQKLPDGQREILQSRMPQDLPPVLAEPHAVWVNANKNGYTVTVRINLFAVGDGGGDLCTADPGSSHADIACFVVDTQAGVICRSTVTAGITGNAGVDNHRDARRIDDCPAGNCGAVAWTEMAAYVRRSAVAARHSPCGFCHQRPVAVC